MQKFTKTLLFSAFILISGYAKSQSLGIPNGQFTVQGTIADATLEAHLEIENSSNTDMSIRVSCDNNQMISSHHTYYCWALCYDTTVCGLDPSTLDALVVPGRTTDVSSFHSYIYTGGVAGTSTISYTFYDVNNPTDQVTTDITFDVLTSGVNEISRGNLSVATPNPANNFTNINYSLPSLKDGRVVIYDMIGNIIKEYPLNNTQSAMIISTSDLSSGVYVYSLINNGQSISTKRLIVSHN